MQVLQLAPSSRLVVDNARREGMRVAAVQANLAGQIRLKPDGWQVQIKPANSWTAAGLVLNTLPLNPLRLDGVQATVEQGADDVIKANGRFHSLQGAGILQADLEYRPGITGGGRATLQTVGPLVMSESSNLLLLLPSTKKRPFTLKGGAVGLDLQLRWSKQGKADVRGSLSLDNGEAMMGNARLAGLSPPAPQVPARAGVDATGHGGDRAPGRPCCPRASSPGHSRASFRLRTTP